MKQAGVMGTGIFFFLFSVRISAQIPETVIRAKVIASLPLTIGYSKTSNLIFPYAIKSVDRGSEFVLVQKPKGVDNILQLKADNKGFEQTNISVVTADGQFYSFIVDYAAEPAILNLSFSKDTAAAGNRVALSDNPIDQETFDKTAHAIGEQKKFLHLSAREQKMDLSLPGIYLTGQAMWFPLTITNQSLIDYKPDYIRFFIRDRKRAKRMAAQEKEILPLYGNADRVIGGMGSERFVFAFAPFTLPVTQELIIQVGEQNGGRMLESRVGHKTLLKARLLQ